MVEQMNFTPNINIPPDLFANVPPSGKAVNLPGILQNLQQGQGAVEELRKRRALQEAAGQLSQDPILAPIAPMLQADPDLIPHVLPAYIHAKMSRSEEGSPTSLYLAKTGQPSMTPIEGATVLPTTKGKVATLFKDLQSKYESELDRAAAEKDRKAYLETMTDLRRETAAQAAELRRQGLYQQAMVLQNNVEKWRSDHFIKAHFGIGPKGPFDEPEETPIQTSGGTITVSNFKVTK